MWKHFMEIFQDSIKIRKISKVYVRKNGTNISVIFILMNLKKAKGTDCICNESKKNYNVCNSETRSFQLLTLAN